MDGANPTSDEGGQKRSGLPPRENEHHPLRLFDLAKSQDRPLYICAPMVRYSKLPFRALLRDYSVDICYTPMILAKEFIRNSKARDSDFTTNQADRPLVVQFGSNNALDFGRAAEMIKPFCDGVDLNCGCPQSWAFQEGIGACLINKPQLVKEMVGEAKKRCGQDFCVSVKIRIHPDLKDTVNLVKTVERAGVDYITVHGRLKNQRSSEPPNLDAIRLVKSVVSVPIVANGDVNSLAEAKRVVEVTGVNGVMTARGLQENPALFAGYERTPWGAVERFMAYAMTCPIPYKLVMQHVGDMIEKSIPKKEKKDFFASNGHMLQLIDWLDERFVLKRPGEEGWGEAVEFPRRHEKNAQEYIRDKGVEISALRPSQARSY